MLQVSEREKTYSLVNVTIGPCATPARGASAILSMKGPYRTYQYHESSVLHDPKLPSSPDMNLETDHPHSGYFRPLPGIGKLTA